MRRRRTDGRRKKKRFCLGFAFADGRLEAAEDYLIMHHHCIAAMMIDTSSRALLLNEKRFVIGESSKDKKTFG